MSAATSIVQDYATRLRQGVPEDGVIREFRERFRHRFQELCIVHLSFLIDVPWNMFEQLSTPPQDFMHKSALKRLLIGAKINPPCSMEGIFRKTGHILRKRQLHEALVQPSFNPNCFLWDAYSTHDLASALKSVLIKLPCPLLTDRLTPLFLQVAGLKKVDSKMNAFESVMLPQSANRSTEGSTIDNKDSVVNTILVESKQIKALRILLQLLPQPNKRVLVRLLRLLLRVVKLESENRMNSVCLGTVFGPVLFPNNVIENLSSSTKSSKFLPIECHERYKRMASMATTLLEVGMDVFLIPLSLAEDIHANSSELTHTMVGGDTLSCSKRVQSSPINQTCARYASGAAHLSRRCDAVSSPSACSPCGHCSAMEGSPPLRMGIRFATPTMVTSAVFHGSTMASLTPTSPFSIPSKQSDSHQCGLRLDEAERRGTGSAHSHLNPTHLSATLDDRLELRGPPTTCSSLSPHLAKPGIVTLARRSSITILPVRCGDTINEADQSPMKQASSVSHLDGVAKCELGKKRRYTEMKLPSCMQQRNGQRRNIFSPCPSLRFLQFRRAFPDKYDSSHAMPPLDTPFPEHRVVAPAMSW
ncbi:unnamed protein product [Dicrocoelium dendriticum]|nr:unnamed protein product [Dicrocoelium dendriticum]